MYVHIQMYMNGKESKFTKELWLSVVQYIAVISGGYATACDTVFPCSQSCAMLQLFHSNKITY